MDYKAAYEEWIEKTEWVQQTCKPSELGYHRADILRRRIKELEEQIELLSVHKTPSEWYGEAQN